MPIAAENEFVADGRLKQRMMETLGGKSRFSVRDFGHAVAAINPE